MKHLTITLLGLFISMSTWAEEVFLECEGGCQEKAWGKKCEDNAQGTEFIPFDPGKKIYISIDTENMTIDHDYEIKYRGNKVIKSLVYQISNTRTEKKSGKEVNRVLRLDRSNGLLMIQDTSWIKSTVGEDLDKINYRYRCKRIEPLF